MEKGGLYVNDGLLRLLELVDQKKKHMQEIYRITQKQSQVLSAQQVESLLEYIGEKQKHIDAVNVLDEEFERVFDAVKGAVKDESFRYTNPKGYEMYTRLRNAVGQVKNAIEAVYKLEMENHDSIQKVMQEVKTKINSINRGKKGYSAYKQPMPQSDGVFIDKKK